ncbi:MAG TPA: EamA family transporter RarD [Actinomycetes bacterium]|nr:EamA family transporter RarD [Actinomycetes bacterium]
MDQTRRGTIAGVMAYLIWGAFPLYWPLLEPAGAVEILAHRIVWSLAFLVALLALARNWSWLRSMHGARLAWLSVAAVTIAVNWGVYIWAINSGHVVETSLGYFINPLVTVALAVVLLGERLRRVQWAALGLALVAVAVLTAGYGRPPWIAFTLALSFGTYGLAKKKANVPAVESLTVETALLFLPGLAYLGWLQSRDQLVFAHWSAANTALLMLCGVVTAVPLLCFGYSAIRVRLSTLGLLQYLTPGLQFLLGVLVFREHMPLTRWVGFALVWAALAVFTLDTLGGRRRREQAVASAAA